MDQQQYTYSLEAYIPPAGDALRLTGVQIDYAYRTSLPLVLNNH